MTNKISLKALFIVIVSILFLLHFGLIIHDPWLTYDDWLIITPLTKIHSFLDYFLAIKNGMILDLQPIRDLSYLIDIKLLHVFPWYSLHFINVSIWILIVYFFTKILKNFNDNDELFGFSEVVTILIFAFSPIASSSVAWLAARKHLLSTLFIFICTAEVTKREKNINYNVNLIKVLFFYLCSLYSQPINLFWPLWYLIYEYVKTKNFKFQFKNTMLVLSMISAAVLNWYYFSIFYSKISLVKFVNMTCFEFITNALMRLSRYFFIVLYPFSALPTPHNPQSLQNILGLLVGVACLLHLYLTSKKEKNLQLTYFLFIAYFILHLAPVLFNSAIFCSDTYVLNASMGLYLILYLVCKNSKLIYAILFGYLIVMVTFNYNYISNFNNTKKLFSYSLQKEATPEAVAMIADYMITDRKYHDAYLISKMNSSDEEDNALLHVHSKAIYLDPTFRLEEKIQLLLNLPYPHPTQSLMLALLYLEQNNAPLFYQRIMKIIDEDYFRWWINKENNAIALGQVLCMQLQNKSNQEQCLFKLNNVSRDFQRFDPKSVEKIKNNLTKFTNDQLFINSDL